MPELKGMNVTHDFAYANVRTNVQRDLAWFSGFGDQDKACVIVGGGPSLADSVQAIKDHRRRGAKIISVNNAMRYLIKHGLTPDAHVMLDAREENLHMVEDAPMSVRYFLARRFIRACLMRFRGMMLCCGITRWVRVTNLWTLSSRGLTKALTRNRAF
jgi:uncharacterized Rossmann fold enzyme